MTATEYAWQEVWRFCGECTGRVEKARWHPAEELWENLPCGHLATLLPAEGQPIPQLADE